MTDYLTEEEQVQQLKSWLKTYGPTVIISIFLAFSLSYAWDYWKEHKIKVATNASEVYDQMLAMRTQNNIRDTEAEAKTLISKFPKTPYANMAALMLARDAAIEKNYEEAKKQLNWVLANSSTVAIQDIAATRIARILIQEKKPEEAIAILDRVKDPSFKALANETKGDAYLMLKDKTKALESYRKSNDELQNIGISRPLLEMKIQNLAT